MNTYFSYYNNRNYIKAEVEMVRKIKKISGLSRLSCLRILRNKLPFSYGVIDQNQKNIFIQLNIELNKAKNFEDIKKIFY